MNSSKKLMEEEYDVAGAIAVHGNLSMEVADELSDIVGVEVNHYSLLVALAKCGALIDIDFKEVGKLSVDYYRYLEDTNQNR